MSKGQGRRGRPLGFKLSDESRRAISESKKGQRHRPETRDKISRSLIGYFRRQNPLSEEITNMYCRADDNEMCEWVYENCEELDESTDILTIKTLRNARKIELSYGEKIEYFSHGLTPEVIVMFKEQCEFERKTPEKLLEEFGF